jgi:hypothetical protein
MSLWRWITRTLGVSDEPAPSAATESPTAKPAPDRGTGAEDAATADRGPALEPASTAPTRPRWPSLLADARERDGRLLSARVTEACSIQGVPCASGSYVTFHANGRLQTAVLARAHTIDGQPIEAGTPIALSSAGSLEGWSVTLAAPREVRVRSKERAEIDLAVVMPAGSSLTFDHRQLRSATLGEALSFDGTTFPAETDLTFGDSGGLSHARSREGLVVNGLRFAPHDEVVFLYGRLLEGLLAEDTTIEGVPCAAQELVRFDEEGRLRRACLSKDTRLSEVPCAEGTRVYLDEEGRLTEGTLSDDVTLAGLPCAAQSVVACEEGRVVLATPCERSRIGGFEIEAGRPVELDPRGRPVAFTLAEAHRFGAIEAPAGSGVVLRPDGAPRLLVITDGREGDAALTGTFSFWFDERGALVHRLPTDAHSHPSRAQLREAASVAGLPAIERMPIELGPDLAPRSLVLARDHRIAGLVAKKRTRVHLHANLAPRELTLAEDAAIDGLPCLGARRLGATMNELEERYDEIVRLHPNGRLAFATLADHGTHRGIPLANGTNVVLREDGSLEVGTPPCDHELAPGLVARGGALLGLHADGTPSLITLAAPWTRGERVHAAGTTLALDPRGTLARDDAPVELGPVTPIERER